MYVSKGLRLTDSRVESKDPDGMVEHTQHDWLYIHSMSICKDSTYKNKTNIIVNSLYMGLLINSSMLSYFIFFMNTIFTLYYCTDTF